MEREKENDGVKTRIPFNIKPKQKKYKMEMIWIRYMAETDNQYHLVNKDRKTSHSPTTLRIFLMGSNFFFSVESNFYNNNEILL